MGYEIQGQGHSTQLPVDSIRSGSPFSCEIMVFAPDFLGVGVVWAYTFNGVAGCGL